VSDQAEIAALDRGRLARGAVSVFAGILGISVGLGFWAGSGEFDWSVWALVLTALGTLALAASTVLLALQTRRQISLSAREVTAVEAQTKALAEQIDLSAREVAAVERQTETLGEQTAAVRDQAEATKRQVAISSATLEAAARPVLVGIAPSPATIGVRETVPYTPGYQQDVEIERIHFEATADMVYCSIPLRNVGAGVAFVQRASMMVAGYYDGRVSQPVVAPGELTRARFAVPRRQGDGRPTDINEITAESGRGFAEFTIYIVYTGASRELVTSTEVTAAEQLANRTFFIKGNEIYDGDTTGRTLLASTANVG
jgi:hypothetical protein